MTITAIQSFRGVPISDARNTLALLESEKARLLALAESVGNMGHWRLEVATGAVTWSDQIYRIAGLDRKSFSPNYDNSRDIVHPEDRDFVAVQFDRAIASRSVVEFDARLVRPKGEVRHIIIKCQAELGDQSVPTALFGVMTDVTDAFSTLRAVHDQHEMLDLAAEMAHLGHWVWSADTNALNFCSDQLAHIHEMTPEVFLGRFPHPSLIASAVESKFREAYRSAITQAVEDGAAYDIEYKLETRFATSRHIKEIGQPIFDERGKLVRYIGTVQDISEAKRREALLKAANDALESQTVALRRSETKFRDMVEGSLQGILVMRGSKIVFSNNSFASMLGVSSAEEVTSLGDVRQILPAGFKSNIDLFWAEASKRRLDGQVRRSQLKGVDGRTIWIDAVGRLVDWDGAPAFLLTVVDVTQRHIADEALVQKSKELEELNLQKDKLFSIIAHDLKGPFNSVLGFASFLAAKAPTLSPEKVTEYADIVYTAATSVHDLLDNLLAWAAVQMRSTALRVAQIDFRALVDASVYPLKTMAADKAIEVINAVGPLQVACDEAMIRIVLRNLVSNGIKFTSGGGKVTVSAEILTDDVGRSTVAITVSDTGIGMDQETLENLFSFSSKASRSGTKGERGTGLGLFICRDIIERHGGVLTVQSRPNEGAAFRFTFPSHEAGR